MRRSISYPRTFHIARIYGNMFRAIETRQYHRDSDEWSDRDPPQSPVYPGRRDAMERRQQRDELLENPPPGYYLEAER